MRRMSTQKSQQGSFQGSTDFSSEDTSKFGLLSQFRNGLSIVWSFSVVISNFWLSFSILYTAGTTTKSRGILLVIEIAGEIILFLEVIMRMLIRYFFNKTYKSLKLIHANPSDSYKLMTFWVIISVPSTAIWYLALDTNSKQSLKSLFAYIILFKLIRMCELVRFARNMQEMLFFKAVFWVVLIKVLEIFFVLIWIAHAVASFWIVFQRIYKNDPLNQFAKLNTFELSPFDQYVEALMYSVSALTGCAVGIIYPSTYMEVILTIIIMVIGATMFAKVFADFGALMYLFSEANIQNKNKLEQAQEYCRAKRIPFSAKEKIRQFYTLKPEIFTLVKYYNLFDSMPTSLRAEISLALNKDLISMVNMFNLGSPSFIQAIARYLEPKLAMEGDEIIKMGELATEMYFLKKGQVEVVASDGKTRIAVLKEGSYFGEIGLFLTGKRTVTIRALSICVLLMISEVNLNTVLDDFPDMKRFLKKVAKQRIKTTHRADIYDEESFGLIQAIKSKKSKKKKNSDKEGSQKTDSAPGSHQRIASKMPLLEDLINEYKTEQQSVRIKSLKSIISDVNEEEEVMHQMEPEKKKLGRSFFEDSLYKYFRTEKNADEHEDLPFYVKTRSSLLIRPISKFYTIWTIVLGVATVFNLLYVPYSIAFKAQIYQVGEWYVILIDVLCILAYIADIYIHSHTGIQRGETLITNVKYIFHVYFSESLIYDVLACLPFDYFLILLEVPQWLQSYMRLLRLLKIIRLSKLMKFQQEKKEGGNKLQRFVILFIFYVYINHIFACVMYMIADHEYDPNSDLDTMFKAIFRSTIDSTPFFQLSDWKRYIWFIYWAACISGGSAYGDIYAVTSNEKMFQAFGLLFFKTYFVLMAANISNMIAVGRTTQTEYKDKISKIESWMKSVKLSDRLRDRIRKYYQYIWDKFKGLDENSIINDLPQTLKEEILSFLLHDMIKNIELFPKDEEGFLLNLIKVFTFVTIPQGEFVYRRGQIATEIYFIMEGTATIYAKDETSVIALVEKNDFLGEISLIRIKPAHRAYSAKATTNLSLAVLNVKELNYLRSKYSRIFETFQHAMKRRMDDLHRKEEKKKVMDHDKPLTFDKVLEGISDNDDRKSKENIPERDSESSEGADSDEVEEVEVKQKEKEKEKERPQDKEKDKQDKDEKEEEKQEEVEPLSATLSLLIPINNNRLNVKRRNIVPRLKTVDLVKPAAPQTPKSLVPSLFAKDSSVIASQRGILQSNRTLLKQGGALPSQRVRFQKQEMDKEFEKFEDALNTMLDHPFSQSNIGTPHAKNMVSPGRYPLNMPITTPGRQHELSMIKESARGKAEGLISHRSQSTARADLKPIIRDLKIADTDSSEEEKDDEEGANIAVLQSMDADKESANRTQIPSKTGVIGTMLHCMSCVSRFFMTKVFPPEGRGRRMLNFLKNLHFSLRTLVIFIIYLWNVVFIPLNIAFPVYFKYRGATLAVELCFSIILIIDCFLLVEKFYEGKGKLMQVMPKDIFLGMSQSEASSQVEAEENEGDVIKFNVHGPIPYLFYIFMQAFPWCLILSTTDAHKRTTSWFLVFLQMLRLTHITRIFRIFKLSIFTKKLKPGVQNLIICIFAFLIINHVFGCILIIIGNTYRDFNDTWLSTLPPPRVDWPDVRRTALNLDTAEIYLYSTYWSYITCSHVGVGDVRVVSLSEKFFNVMFSFLSTSVMVFFLGVINSLVESIMPQYQKNYQLNYNTVMDFLKRCHYDQFVTQADLYYDYIWQTEKGMNENKILADLPDSLKIDIQLSRYGEAIQSSPMFRDRRNRPDNRIIQSYFKLANIQIFLPGEELMTAGRVTSSVYLMLEGKAQRIAFDKQSLGSIIPGEYYGGVLKDTRACYSIKAVRTCKVAGLDAKQYQLLCDAFPDWGDKMISQERKNNTAVLEKLDFFKKKLDKESSVNENEEEEEEYDFVSAQQMKDYSGDPVVNEALIAYYTHPENYIESPQSSQKLPGSQDVNLESESASKSSRGKDLKDSKDSDNFKAIEKKASDKSDQKSDQNKSETGPTYDQTLIREQRSSSQGIAPPITLEDSDRINSSDSLNSGQGRMSLVHRSKVMRMSQLRHFQNEWRNSMMKRRYYISPNSAFRSMITTVHLAFIIYSSIALLYKVSLAFPVKSWFLTMEVIVFIESSFYIVAYFFTAQNAFGVLTLDRKILLKGFLSRGYLYELVALIPFNIILMDVGAFNPIANVFRIARLCQMTRVPAILGAIEARYPKIATIIPACKYIMLFCFFLNTVTCFWIWFGLHIEGHYLNRSNYWLKDIGLMAAYSSKNYFKVYSYHMLFVLNIITGTGYQNLAVHNDTERIVFIILIYFCSTFYAYAFGLMASESQLFPAKYNEIFDRISKINSILDQNKILPGLKYKVEQYYSYIIDARSSEAASLDIISGLLPKNIVSEMAKIRIEPFYNLPVFKGSPNHFLLQDLAESFTQRIYLPYDYISNKGDYPDEMYYIVTGHANVMAPNERNILKQLSSGDFFGAIPIILDCRRVASVVAETHCLVYVIKRAAITTLMINDKVISAKLDVESLDRLIEYENLSGTKLIKSIFKEKLQRRVRQNRSHSQGYLGSLNIDKLGTVSQNLDMEELPVKDLEFDMNPLNQLLDKKEMKERELADEEERARKPHNANFNIRKMKLIADPKSDEENNSDESNMSMNAFVEDDEWDNTEQQDARKPSLRPKMAQRKRRYSRLSLGMEKETSKGTGLRIQWGINMG